MANLEKLVKAFEALKVFQLGSTPEDASNKKKDPLPSKKEKISNCNIIADCICSLNLRNVADYPKFLGIAMETFLMLCDDVESDVRIVSDECLNRTIKVLMDSSLGRLQVELYKEIKKNGCPRSLRAALWRFADLSHLIRPQKCRPYVVNLLPCLARISKRPEESIQETLAVAVHKMAPVLMGFTNDTETKVLLKSFLPNIKSSSATMRRTACSSLALICQYSRKPQLFAHWLLQALIDIGDNDSHTLLGVLLAIRHLLPLLASCLTEPGQASSMKESFGQKKTEPQAGQVTVEQLVQVYEILLHFVDHQDHNVVTASLETLQQLLKNAPSPLLHILITRSSITRTGVFAADLDHLQRVASQARLPSVSDDTAIEDDLDTEAEVREESGETSLLDGSQVLSETADDSVITSDEPPIVNAMTTEGAYSNIQIGDLAEDKGNLSQCSSTEALSETSKFASPAKDVSLVQVASVADMDVTKDLSTVTQGDIDITEVIQPHSAGSAPQGAIREGDIGNYCDKEAIPLLHCCRLLCSKLLLTGYKQGLIPDRQVRVSVKALALNCISCIATLYPSALLEKLHMSSSVPGELQCMKDVLLYMSHSDPQLKGNTAVLVGNFIKATLHESRGHFSRWMRSHANEDQEVKGLFSLDELTSLLIGVLEDDSAVASRLGLVALKSALPAIIHSSHSHLAIKTLLALLRVRENPYWLVKVELLELLGQVDYRIISYLEAVAVEARQDLHQFVGSLDLQERVLRDVVIFLLGDEDGRVRSASAAALTRMVPGLFYQVDNALNDPVIRLAKDISGAHFEPMLHEFSVSPQSVHSSIKPFEGSNGAVVRSVTESVLSRVVALLVEEVTKSASKHLTYGCCKALCKLSEEYSVPQYAAAWCCCPLNAIVSSGRSSSTSSPAHPRTFSRSWSGGSTGRFVDSIASVTSNTSSLSLEELASHSAGGPLPIIISILTASPIAFDFGAHQDTLRLAGNVFAGAAYKCLRKPEEGLSNGNEDTHWASLGDRLLVPLADQLLAHLARLLNICAHVIDETNPGPPQSKPSLPSLPNAPSLSPIKRKTKASIKDDSANVTGSSVGPSGGGSADKSAEKSSKTPSKEPGKEGDKEKNKKDGLGAFYNLPQYVKLFEALRGAYSTYKISLELSGSEKFISILRTALEVLSQVLEIACLPEVAKHAEEFLGYLKSTFLMEPTATVLCVQQLLKSIFGTNLASQWEGNQNALSSRKPGKATRLQSSVKPGLYHCCFTKPYTQFTQCLASATFRASAHSDQEESFSLINWLKKKSEKKVPAILKPGSKTDKSAVASYIRLFEPLVIKALKQYTVTSCLELQRQVLHLLAQLVELRVNYCLLDSDQIFIGFVIKQFEFIEEGQIRRCELLLPSIFNFLVLLSYERYHSKTIIAMPKVIQLCDGIMASGLDPELHVIPALQCIVQDLFVLRGTSTNRADAGKDLETQREVVVSMLLRLLNYHQVCELVIVVLQQCRKEGEDRWKRLSRQVTDLVLPMLAKQQVNLNSQTALDVIHRLFECVATSVFRPVDILLKTLFAPPQELSTVQSLERWLCLVLIVLRVLMAQSKEEVVLSRLHELGLGVTVLAPSQDGSSQAVSTPGKHGIVGSSSEETLARFLLQVVGVASTELSSRLSNLAHCRVSSSCSFLSQELAHLLLYITHMFQSGIYRRVAMTAMNLVRQETPPHFLSVHQINSAFRDLIAQQPTLTLQWCNVLILLNFEDQSWWGGVLQTPKKYMVPSPKRGSFDEDDMPLDRELCVSKEIVRRGGLILFCDYVCENLNDAEHMTWVVINHVNDLIHLSQEPPVQDFISAIHRNSAASGLFIQAINSRCENLSKAVLAQKTLKCLEAIHLSQSGALLTLLIDKLLHTHHLAVSRFCHTIACRRVEMLLAEDIEVSSGQLPLEDLEKLLQFMKSTGLTQRHSRLASLLNKLRQCMCPESSLTLSPEKTHPLAISTSALTEIKINKDWFMSIVRDQCYTKRNVQRECAQLLQFLDYPSILNIIMSKDCSLSILEECVSLGSHLSLAAAKNTPNKATDGGSPSPVHENNLHPLFRAAQITLFRHINSFINMLPVPHQIIDYNTKLTAKQEQYRDKLDDIFTESRWMDAVFQLSAGLLRYLVALPLFPWKPSVPDEAVKDISRFSILCLEAVHWMLSQGQFPHTLQLVVTIELFAVAMRTPQLLAVIGQKEQCTWVFSATRTIHQLLCNLLVLPGNKLVRLPNQDSSDDLPTASFDVKGWIFKDTVSELYLHHAIRACDQISELVHSLKTHLNPANIQPGVPPALARPIRNSIICLARLDVVNSYARTPPLVWKLGWMPSPLGETRTKLPPLPLHFLQERDVLREFICRVNLLGWTSRQQFEETWMCLLGVLNPVQLEGEQHSSAEEETERTQCAVLATRCITALLVSSTLTPHSGDPSTSLPEHQPRDKPLAFLHTRVGKKLARVRSLVEQEIRSLTDFKSDLRTHHGYTDVCLTSDSANLLSLNMDREHGRNDFLLSQLSIEYIWSVVGMINPSKVLQSESSASDSDPAPSSSDVSPLTPDPPHEPLNDTDNSSRLRSRSFEVSGLDLNSCLQFLLEMYGTLLSPNANPKPPLMQLTETVKSVVALSDMFVERAQYEWMFDTLLEVYRVHPTEDEIMNQYLAVGICKAAAILGMDAAILERVMKMVETFLKSTHLPTKVSVLYGSLYLLESGTNECSSQVVSVLVEALSKTLSSITQLHTTIHSQQHVLVMWALTLYLIENYLDVIKDSDFLPKVLQTVAVYVCCVHCVQMAIQTVSAPEEVTPLQIYQAVIRGLERLVLADVLSKQDTEALIKLSVDRLCLPSSQRSLAGLGLMLTCMYSDERFLRYTGKQTDQWSPTVEVEAFEFSSTGPLSHDPESLIVAMERVTVLFDRIRKGCPYEARVIARVLPSFLSDFFPPQDIMNKVIGEFLSSQQPHPQLMARVVFQVFDHLLERQQLSLVHDWVMLSLSNFTQRTPVAMAIWSLTCFFICSSTNQWLRALLTHVLGRMGKMDTLDRRLFIISALEFRSQLQDESQLRAFYSTFQSVATVDPTYSELLACL